MPDYVDATLTKAEAAGAHPVELHALRRRLEQLTDPSAGLLPGDELEPLPDLPRLEDLPEPPPDRSPRGARPAGRGEAQRRPRHQHGPVRAEVAAERQAAGTASSTSSPRQVLALRRRHGARLPLLLMNSPTTREPSLAALRRHPGSGRRAGAAGLPAGPGAEDPRRTTSLPVQWPADPELEWCPPGPRRPLHRADRLRRARRPARAPGCAGASCPTRTTSARSPTRGSPPGSRPRSVPFVMEVGARHARPTARAATWRRTAAASCCGRPRRCPTGDESFTDVERWRFYNTNTLWIDLRGAAGPAGGDPGGPPLPLIVNRKTVDPRDPASTPVLQLETAMGAAIGSIAGARALQVPRDRFAPVKTTDDLLRGALRRVRADGRTGRMAPAFDRAAAGGRRWTRRTTGCCRTSRRGSPTGRRRCASATRLTVDRGRHLRRRRRRRGRGDGHRALGRCPPGRAQVSMPARPR